MYWRQGIAFERFLILMPSDRIRIHLGPCGVSFTTPQGRMSENVITCFSKIIKSESITIKVLQDEKCSWSEHYEIFGH